MKLRKYSRQYLIDAVLFLGFILSIICQEYLQIQNPIISTFALVFVLIYPAKYILALLKLKMESIAVIAILCVAIGIVMVEFLGMSVSLVGSALNVPLFTKESVLISVTGTIFIFMIFSKDFIIPSIRFALSPYIYLSILIIIISCFGSVLMTQYQENIGNLFFWVLVLFTTSLLILKKDLTSQTKTIMIFSISLSCLLNIVLISNFLTGWDIFDEFSIVNTTIAQGAWNVNLFSNVNSMLSIAVLAPSLSWLSNLDILWTLKLVYPIVFSLVPVCAFIFGSKMVNEKAGIIGALLFIFIQGFLFEMPGIARQEIAEIFLATILMVAFMVEFSDYQKAALGILFGFGLITSHYATALLFIFIIAIYFIVRFVLKVKEKPIFSVRHFMTLIAIELTWLLFIGSRGVLLSLNQIVQQIYNASANEFSVANNVVSNRVSSPTSTLHTIGKYVFILAMGIIFIGILSRLYKKRRNIDNYTCLIAAFGLLLVTSLTLGNFLSDFSDIRMITLLLIVLGTSFCFGIFWIFGIPGIRRHRNMMLPLVAVFIALYIIFNSGLAYSIFNDGPTSITLNNNTVPQYPEFTDSEIKGAMWSQSNISRGQMIIADSYYTLVVGGFGWFSRDLNQTDTIHGESGELIYLGGINLQDRGLITQSGPINPISIDSIWNYPTVYNSHDVRILFVN